MNWPWNKLIWPSLSNCIRKIPPLHEWSIFIPLVQNSCEQQNIFPAVKQSCINVCSQEFQFLSKCKSRFGKQKTKFRKLRCITLLRNVASGMVGDYIYNMMRQHLSESLTKRLLKEIYVYTIPNISFILYDFYKEIYS